MIQGRTIYSSLWASPINSRQHIQYVLLSDPWSYHIQHLLPSPSFFFLSLPFLGHGAILDQLTKQSPVNHPDISPVLPSPANSFPKLAHILLFLFPALLLRFLPYHRSPGPLYQPWNLPSCFFMSTSSSRLSSTWHP